MYKCVGQIMQIPTIKNLLPPNHTIEMFDDGIFRNTIPFLFLFNPLHYIQQKKIKKKN